MTDQEFSEILALGYERRGIEFKGPGSLQDKQLRIKVVRAALGMTNLRDGGLMVIGVEDQGSSLNPLGLGAADLATWKYDDIADAISAYADPSVAFDFEVRQHDGKRFVVLRIHEFEDIPVLCKKDYPGELRRGGCYVRSRRKPETSEIPTQEDMRDLLDLAIEKGLRRFFAQARAAGIHISVPETSSDRELYERQRKDFP